MTNIASLVLLVLLSLANCKNLYQVFGLKQNATQQEIKAAYRKLAKIYHPDKNKEDGAAEKYIEINEAHEILSNTKLRRIYDRKGYEAAKNPDKHQESNDLFSFLDN